MWIEDGTPHNVRLACDPDGLVWTVRPATDADVDAAHEVAGPRPVRGLRLDGECARSPDYLAALTALDDEDRAAVGEAQTWSVAVAEELACRCVLAVDGTPVDARAVLSTLGPPSLRPVALLQLATEARQLRELAPKARSSCVSPCGSGGTRGAEGGGARTAPATVDF
jgi:hypothetical protein